MIGKVLIENPIWGRSSVGRALHWQCRGHGFESHRLHYIKSLEIIGFQGFFMCAENTAGLSAKMLMQLMQSLFYTKNV